MCGKGYMNFICMKETKRIIKLFNDLADGSPWIDVNFAESLSGLTAKQAACRPIAGGNSIWEIIHHLTNWRKNVLQRIQGKVIKTPSHNYFRPLKDTSEKAWSETYQDFEKAGHEWVSFLDTFNSKEFETIYPGNRLNYYEHIHGILQHDAYHLGQINILRKLV